LADKGGFKKQPFIAKRSEDLIGRDVVEAKQCLFGLAKALPMVACALKQHVGPRDVGFDEGARAID